MMLKKLYDKLVAKVHTIDTSDFVLKTKYQTGKTELEKKIPDLSNLVEKTKLTELENNSRSKYFGNKNCINCSRK